VLVLVVPVLLVSVLVVSVLVVPVLLASVLVVPVLAVSVLVVSAVTLAAALHTTKFLYYRMTKKKAEPVYFLITSTKTKQNYFNFIHLNFCLCMIVPKSLVI